MSSDHVLFVCPPEVLLADPQGKSFEVRLTRSGYLFLVCSVNLRLLSFAVLQEIRVADYLKAYTTTGQPPAPVPAIPTSAAARAALNLPPLFEPSRVSPEGDDDNIQLWEATANGDELYQALTAKPKWSSLSFEVRKTYDRY